MSSIHDMAPGLDLALGCAMTRRGWWYAAIIALALTPCGELAARKHAQQQGRPLRVRRASVQLGPPSHAAPSVWAPTAAHLDLLRRLPPALASSAMRHRMAVGAHADAIGVVAGANLRADKQAGVITSARGTATWGSNLAYHDGIDIFWAGAPGALVNPFTSPMRVAFVPYPGSAYYGRVQLMPVGSKALGLDVTHAVLPPGLADGAIIAPGATFAVGTDRDVAVPGYSHVHLHSATDGVIAGVQARWFQSK